MKICMIGTGYVGLVSAACFSDFGWEVICVDKDEDRVARLRQGEMPIYYEPGLHEQHGNGCSNARQRRPKVRVARELRAIWNFTEIGSSLPNQHPLRRASP